MMLDQFSQNRKMSLEQAPPMKPSPSKNLFSAVQTKKFLKFRKMVILEQHTWRAYTLVYYMNSP